MNSASVDSSFFADFQNLAAIKKDAKAQSPEALRAAARQFESLFTQMMLKSMRAATPQDSLLGSDQQDFYQEMFDQQMSVQLSKGRGLGLADMLVRQLMQQQGATATAAMPVEVTPAPASASSLTDSSAPAWPPATREDFVTALMPAAKAAGEQLGVDPTTLIAHAALETGWGKYTPTAEDGSCSYNLFGIKAGSKWTGEQVTAVTKEFDGGSLQTVNAQFRAYTSPADCMRNYAELLSGNERYSDALGTGEDAKAFATALQRGGYATDPNYANKLTSIALELKSRLAAPLTPRDAA